ncbi:deaminase domain-containing protein [Fluviispira sanaruensis]|uniref:Deaminase n=1 Tax=Fluviispira sanaruensis TaxID=2493639 RepID=A0A4P2VM49_FLUSA|nr:deaminase domain-containing protein [Fluviispira sanaruensis]BBH53808.1 hypothetical protein JCM31447_22580 [Fluviispira sanaruensis]
MKIKLINILIIFNILFINNSYATNNQCVSQEKIPIKNKVISVGNEQSKMFLIVNKDKNISTISPGNTQKIYEVKNELYTYITNTNNTYFHFISEEIQKVNSDINSMNNSFFTLKSDGQGAFHLSSGEIREQDVISILATEALTKIKNRKTILIDYISSDKQAMIKYLLNFNKLYENIKLSSEKLALDILPKVEEKVIDINTVNGYSQFEQFKDALKEIRQTINDPTKTIMVVKNDNPDEAIMQKAVEARKKLLQGLNESVTDKKQNSRDHNAKKTISYAKLTLNNAINNKIHLYSVSGENFKFVPDEDEPSKIFVNLKKNNHNFPYITPAENPLTNMQRILKATQAIKNGGNQDLSTTRYSDSEAKILEAIVDNTKDTAKETQGDLEIYTSKPACLSCRNVYNYFKEIRPKINVKILTLTEDDHKNLYKSY